MASTFEPLMPYLAGTERDRNFPTYVVLQQNIGKLTAVDVWVGA